MNNISEFKRYYSFSDVFTINDTELKVYLSNIIQKQYVNELGFIKKEDILNKYVEIFKNNSTDDTAENSLKDKLLKFKLIVDDDHLNISNINHKKLENIYENGGWYGC